MDEPLMHHNAYLGAFGRLSQGVFLDLPLDEQLSTFVKNNRLDKDSKSEDIFFVQSISEMMRGRCFFVSSSSWIGFAPNLAAKEDMICGLLGSFYPVILRERDGHYILIVAAYVNGFMDGKAMEGLIAGKYDLGEFEIH
jgi:hypothetical protein